MQKGYLIVDPQHEYARELIQVAKKTHNLDAICIYLDSRSELYKRQHFMQLRQANAPVLGHYFLDQMSAQEIARVVKQKFEVVGIMPYFEQALLPAKDLCEAFEITWNDSQVIARFRDKSGLKEHLRKDHPDIALGASRRVANVDDVFSQPLFERFVIKPNDGFANRDIGFFDQNSKKEDIAAYFAANGHGICVLEEQLFGTEYAVNGQMDHLGRATVVSILEYERVPANGKPNVYHHTLHVPRTHEAFEAIAPYATQVMQASGLKRAPFHLELMLTQNGPRLIEVGARFGGTRYVFMTNACHDNVFNHFEMAAHHWLFDTPFAGQGPNWAFYDKVAYVHLDGIAKKTEKVYTLSGIDDIERMPEFDGWVVKPHIGGQMRRTVDLYTVPYSVHLKSLNGKSHVLNASKKVEQLLQINKDVSVAQKMWIDGQTQLSQVAMRGRWLWQKAKQKVLRQR